MILICLTPLNYFCSRDKRYEFVKAKYVYKRYVLRTSTSDEDLIYDLEQGIANGDVYQVLQAWAESVSMSSKFLSTVSIYRIC